LLLTAGLFFFGRTIPSKKTISAANNQKNRNTESDHNSHIIIDSILALAKRQLSTEQVARISRLENTLSGGQVTKDQQIHIYHQLARFWADSARIFEPYAWYLAEAARLENSEKTLTFAAQLFLDNLQNEEVPGQKQWKALQAKDLFERSLKINPENDSTKVGLGACYLFGDISTTPMEGITRIKEVADRDSTNVYAQLMLVKGSLLSGQFDKAISRLHTIVRLEKNNAESMLLLADLYERTGDKPNAVTWYQKCLPFVKQADVKKAIEKRIEALKN